MIKGNIYIYDNFWQFWQLWQLWQFLIILTDFWKTFKICRKLSDFQKISVFWIFFSIFRKFSDFLKVFRFFERFCDLRHDTWDTDYISDNWEQQYGQLHCDLWIESDGDSIRNSCDVLLVILTFHGGNWQLCSKTEKLISDFATI